MQKDKSWTELMEELSPELAKEFFDRWNHHFQLGTINHPALPIEEAEERDLKRARKFLAHHGISTVHS